MFPYRQAEAILESFVSVVGPAYFKPDLARNAVLDQLYKDHLFIRKRNLQRLCDWPCIRRTAWEIRKYLYRFERINTRRSLVCLKGSSLTMGTVHVDPREYAILLRQTGLQIKSGGSENANYKSGFSSGYLLRINIHFPFWRSIQFLYRCEAL